MDERTAGSLASEHQPPNASAPAERDAGPGSRALDDSRALTILTTEHWSLLSARSLVYNEAFARAGMFLTFLSATLVALGLVSTGTGFSREFLFIAAVLLGVDLFIGLATLGRMVTVSEDDLRLLGGMNRLRHAYHEMVPGLAPYFISSQHDDADAITEVYGGDYATQSGAGILHGLTTAPGMIGVICAAIAGALVGVVVLIWTGAPGMAAALATAGFVIAMVVETVVLIRKVETFLASIRPSFPSPAGPPSPSGKTPR